MARRTLADLEAELYAGSPDDIDAADPDAILILRRILRLIHGVMLEDERRHRQCHSDASRRTANRQWADMGQPKRKAG